MHIGSTKKDEKQPDPELVAASKRARALSTQAGFSAEVQVLQQRVEFLYERCNKLEGLIMTLAGKFQNFETQRAIELAGLVNGGPTVVE